jgi:flagellar protein FlaG
MSIQVNVTAGMTALQGDLPSPSERVPLQQPNKVDAGVRSEETLKHIQEALAQLNDQMRRNGRDLSFNVDERIDRVIITVKNPQTGEVIRQIPTEEVIRLAHSIEDLKGLLVNQRL